MIFEPGQHTSGFIIQRVENIPDIDAVAYVGVHEASGARLLYLANDDTDKGFAIGFRTPPQDDTGVFHILEHSVLCGSDRFPVKEPFVNLLKNSMQTFLNAMTFPDKTLYPVSSTNEQDLMNLAKVYMDAVFAPAIRTDPLIFQQEGWHLEIQDDHPVFNGVVFNEMKGVLSDPEEMLAEATNKALFPDTCYRFESGGNPAAIPTLTYEHYLEEYQRHYRPDNAWIILYGDLDASRMLAFLDEDYLTPWAATHDKPSLDSAGTPLVPRAITTQEPVCNLDVQTEANTTPDNEMLSLNYVFSQGVDCRTQLAVEVLISALAGTNESPLRRRLLDADLADRVTFPLAEEILQPYVTVLLRGLHEGAVERFKPTFDQILTDMIAEGFDKDALLAAIARQEFQLREKDFGTSNGVIYAMSALSTWLYDDDAATDGLKFAEHFSALRDAVNTDYFEQLAGRVFLDNPHMAQVHLRANAALPSPEQPLLDSIEASWSSEDKQHILKNLETLRAHQEREDSPEALACLPQLTLADLGKAAPRPAWHTEQHANNGATVLIHDVETSGITYVNIVMPLPGISADDLPYLSLLSRLLGKVDTSTHTAHELDTLAMLYLGDISFSASLLGDDTDPDHATPALQAQASALVPNSARAANLLTEILLTSDFSKLDRIKTALLNTKISLEDVFINYGHLVARSRVEAATSRYAAAGDLVNGIGFYRELTNLLSTWDTRAAALPDRFAALARQAASAAHPTISIAGGAEARRDFLSAWDAALNAAGIKPIASDATFVPPARIAPNEALTVPSTVTYTALGCDLLQAAAKLGWDESRARAFATSGSWEVARSMMNFDWLWNNVRVKGGAYGVGFVKSLYRSATFYSYRDPHVDETLERYRQTAPWLEELSLSDSEFEGYLISTVSAFDKPIKPRQLVQNQLTEYLRKRSPELRLTRRAQALATTPDDIHRIGRALGELMEYMTSCTVGSPAIIKAAKTPFTVQELIGCDAPEDDAEDEDTAQAYEADED